MALVIRKLDASAAGNVHQNPVADGGSFVCVGDEILVDDEVVERVNSLVLVRPLKTRYDAAQGDVVVGRVTEVAGKRWKVDLSSRQEASLLLSAVNLPGGVQRRRNAEDELRMREVLREGDLVSAEVQSVHLDGGVALHTRSSKYGKLVGGQLVVVPAALVKRQKQHFHTLEPSGIHLVLGCNGLVWVAPFASKGYGDDEQEGVDATAQSVALAQTATKQQLQAVIHAAAAIRALARCYLPIFPAAINNAIELSEEQGVAPHQMLGPDFLVLLAASEAQRRQAASVRNMVVD